MTQDDASRLTPWDCGGRGFAPSWATFVYMCVFAYILEEGPPLGEVRHWEPHFCQCGCQFGAFGATLRPIWSVLDPTWSILGPLWRVLRVTSGPLWQPLDASQANLAALGSNRGPKGPVTPKSRPKASQMGAKMEPKSFKK